MLEPDDMPNIMMKKPKNQRASVIVVALLCAVTLSACNGGAAGDTGSRPTATFGPAVQTRLAEDTRRPPTRTPTPADRALEATPTSTPEPPTPTPGSAEQREPAPDGSTKVLLAALLTADEMPDGWVNTGTFTQDELEQGMTGDDGMLVSPGTEDSCGSEFHDPYLNETTALFEREDSGRIVMQNISLYANGQSAELVLSQWFAAIELCPEYEEMYDDVAVLTSYQPLEYPALGDQSAAYLIATSAEGYDTELVLVVFRIDRTISMIMHADFEGSTGSFETWGTQEIVLRAHEKMHSVRELLDSLERPPVNVV